MRVEISLGFVVSLRPRGAAFWQAGSTRLDFVRTAAEAMALFDGLVHKLQHVGFQLHTGKTVVLTSAVQPPSFVHTHNESKLRVLQPQEAHTWLGCMISAARSRNMHLDL